MEKTGFVVENIVLAHRFYAPPHWEFPDYLRPRPRHGLIYVLEGGASYEMGDGRVLRAEAPARPHLCAGGRGAL